MEVERSGTAEDIGEDVTNVKGKIEKVEVEVEVTVKTRSVVEVDVGNDHDVSAIEKALESVEECSAAGEEASSSKQMENQKGFKIPENWVNAPEFVPSWLANTAGGAEATEFVNLTEEEAGQSQTIEKDEITLAELECAAAACHISEPEAGAKHELLDPTLGINDTSSELCPYAVIGECRYGYKCILVHGLKCEYCGQYCLHPSDPSQRERHQKSCIAEHESNMNLSFAIASSIEKVCGICYEKVLSKNTPGEQRFGILPNCSHCYCLSCIRRWRSERQFDNKTIRACPECRVTSDFVCPSRYWVDNKEDKEKLIGSYKVALSKKPCRYYRNGDGQCPFGNKCFYLHAIDGNVIDVGPPRRISGSGGQGRASARATAAQTLSIWEYIEEWEMQWLDLEDFMGMFDSDTTSEFSLPDMDDDLELEGDDMYDMYLDWDRLYR